MSKIILEEQGPLLISILQKCAGKLPKWNDISGVIPFFITGSIGVAAYLVDRAERQREQKKIRKGQNKQKEIIQQRDSLEQMQNVVKLDTDMNPINGDIIKQHKSSVENEIIAGQAQRNQDVNDQFNPLKLQTICAESQKRNNNHLLDQHKSNSDLEMSIQKIENNIENNGNFLSSYEQELLNINLALFGDECKNEIETELNTEQGQGNVSNHNNLKTLLPREKRQKRAPIKINRNFATDTENNEKLQKLKSIVQKEKKLEDKVFFQMFLNIVGTEADEDNDD